MALDTGTTEPKTQGTQTGKSLISLKYIKSLKINVSEIGIDAMKHDEDESRVNLAASKKASINSISTSQVEKGDWLKYSRDTMGLGKKGLTSVNVYT